MTALTVPLTPEIEAKLDEIAGETRRTPSELAADALSAYLDHELRVIAGIKRGLADADAGRTVDHAEAMARIRATIDLHRPSSE